MNSQYGINRYYTSLSKMHKNFEKCARKDGFDAKNPEEYWVWRDKSRVLLRNLLGLNMFEKCDMRAIVEERVVLDDGIVREKVIIETEKDVWMPTYILIPEKCANNPDASVFIVPCGHLGGGKHGVVGDDRNPLVKKQIEVYHHDCGLQLAKRGYVAVCPDARGFGERRDICIQDDDNFIQSSCAQLAHMAEPLGLTVTGMNTWDLMRLVDYLKERNEWDISDLGCLGFSGGGLQSLYFAALDDRIHKVIISGYMYGFKDSLLEMNNNCSCNYVPHLWEHFDCGDLGALLVPKKVVIQSGKSDKLNGSRGITNAVEQVDIMRYAYDLMDMEDNLIHDIVEGPHMWYEDRLDTYLDFFND